MNKSGGILFILGVIVASILVLAIFTYGFGYAFTSGYEEVTIKDKWVKYSGEDAKYLVSSSDGQVFQITDSLIKMRFDSSNLYAKIESGQNCKIITQGWRFPLFSDYKNIIEADCVVNVLEDEA